MVTKILPSACDVLVIGGGPAGATAAALLAQYGRDVVLLERDAAPRFKIGESLMPATWWIFERLGVIDRLEQSHFVRKHGIQFFARDGRPGQPFYFFENDPRPASVTFQVIRSEFDALLLERACELGARVVRGANVKQVLFDGDRAVGARVEILEGDVYEISAKVVVDASGQSSAISRKFDLREIDPLLMNASVFAHFEGAQRDPGVDEGSTLTMLTDNGQGWFWYIPLPDDRVSVGVVGKLDYLIRGRAADPQQLLDEEIARCPALTPRLAGAHQITDAKVLKDFSYVSREIAGDGWVLAGDAWGFLDPIYSTGVYLALRGGAMGADSIEDAFRHDDFSATRLGAHGPKMRHAINAMRNLVYAFYAPEFSFGRFLKAFPHHRRTIVEILTGNVFDLDPEPFFADMAQVIQLPGRPAPTLAVEA